MKGYSYIVKKMETHCKQVQYRNQVRIKLWNQYRMSHPESRQMVQPLHQLGTGGAMKVELGKEGIADVW